MKKVIIIFTFILIVAIAGTAVAFFFNVKFGGGVALLAMFVLLALFVCLFMLFIDSWLGPVERYDFNINNGNYSFFYDTDSKQYFKASVDSYWNPFHCLEKEYIDADIVEEFLQTYEEYEKYEEILKNSNLFG